jgi:hypothetical protein
MTNGPTGLPDGKTGLMKDCSPDPASSIEVSRSALLFSAKCKALRQFDKRFTEERAQDSVNWVEILKIMWECENFFESEHREWLRIMHDARWSL